MMSTPRVLARHPIAPPRVDKRLPQYLRVYEVLRRRIEDHEYPVGSFLPPEPELVRLLAVSRTTVRKAVELLTADGFVVVRRGRGTEILDFRAIQKLHFVTSFSETLREQGFQVTYRDVQVSAAAASPSLSKDLEVAQGSPLVLVHRLALANGKPIALMDNYLVAELAPGIEAKADRIQSLVRVPGVRVRPLHRGGHRLHLRAERDARGVPEAQDPGRLLAPGGAAHHLHARPPGRARGASHRGEQVRVQRPDRPAARPRRVTGGGSMLLTMSWRPSISSLHEKGGTASCAGAGNDWTDPITLIAYLELRD